MKPLEISIVRDTEKLPAHGREGFVLGSISVDGAFYGYTLEDEDRRLEDGGAKIKGTTAMPLGRYEVDIYRSSKHGFVPLFLDVPQFTYTEIHGANHAEELLGCVAVGQIRTHDGVARCNIVLTRIVSAMQAAIDEGREVFCTISRSLK